MYVCIFIHIYDSPVLRPSRRYVLHNALLCAACETSTREASRRSTTVAPWASLRWRSYASKTLQTFGSELPPDFGSATSSRTLHRRRSHAFSYRMARDSAQSHCRRRQYCASQCDTTFRDRMRGVSALNCGRHSIPGSPGCRRSLLSSHNLPPNKGARHAS